MIRKIVKIDEEKCTGCGLCASACHENAIVMENGKAHLLRDDFCDGFGFQPVLQEQLLLKNAKVRNIIRLLLK